MFVKCFRIMNIATLALVLMMLLVAQPGSADWKSKFPWSKDKNKDPQEEKVCHGWMGCFFAKHKAGEIVKDIKEQFLYLPLSPKVMHTRFFVYTAEKPDLEREISSDIPQASLGLFDTNKTVAILIHGYTDSYKKEGLVGIKNALLKYSKGEVGTVVMVDWSKGSFHHSVVNQLTVSYFQAVANIQVLALQIVRLVNVLREKRNLDPKNVYLVGHSLGAQTAGLAGKKSQRLWKWKFGRITGLDPAGPLFIGKKFKYLHKGDADFVDIVHTSSYEHKEDSAEGQLGFPFAVGDVDFFPNGAHHQPQCPAHEDPNASSCVHQSALAFYEVSLNSTDICELKAYPAANWADFKEQMERKKIDESEADSVMGYWAYKHKGRGARYLETYESVPFCEED